MRLEILAIGRARAGPERDLYDNYAKRVTWPLRLREIEEKRSLPPAELKEREGELILAAVPAKSVVLALDEGGRSYRSEEFARLIADIWMRAGFVPFSLSAALRVCRSRCATVPIS